MSCAHVAYVILLRHGPESLGSFSDVMVGIYMQFEGNCEYHCGRHSEASSTDYAVVYPGLRTLHDSRQPPTLAMDTGSANGRSIIWQLEEREQLGGSMITV